MARELIRFVREILGCGCPDEVLARITEDASERAEAGLDVGGRLLVRVLSAQDVDGLIGDFPDIVERLRDERDRRGFNRLRMVVAHPEPDMLGQVLDGMLGVIAAADDRVFLHTLDIGDLPGVLSRTV